MTEEKITGEILSPDYSDTSRFRILDGGAVYGLQEGRIVAHLHKGDGKYQLTSARAKELAVRREELAQQEARDALDDEAIEQGLMPKDAARTGRGWYALNRKVAQLAFEAKTGRNVEGLLTFLARSTGHLSREREEKEIRHVHEVSNEAATNLLEFMREAIKPGNTIDGQVIDDTP